MRLAQGPHKLTVAEIKSELKARGKSTSTRPEPGEPAYRAQAESDTAGKGIVGRKGRSTAKSGKLPQPKAVLVARLELAMAPVSAEAAVAEKLHAGEKRNVEHVADSLGPTVLKPPKAKRAKRAKKATEVAAKEEGHTTLPPRTKARKNNANGAAAVEVEDDFDVALAAFEEECDKAIAETAQRTRTRKTQTQQCTPKPADVAPLAKAKAKKTALRKSKTARR